MSWLHYHATELDEAGEPVEVEKEIEVTGAVRVQASTPAGFQTFEMAVDGLNTVELLAENPNPPVEEPAVEETQAASKSKSSKSSS
jgi:hypothetical protein